MKDRSRLPSRRILLKGAGVAVALPWLESVPVWGVPAKAIPPRRFAALFMGNGINEKHWWARGAGTQMELGACLEPLTALKTKLNVVNGLFNKAATNVGIHPPQTGNILSGVPLQKGAELRGGVSVDQVMAGQVGEDIAQPSLVLGCEQPTTGYHETNYSLAYSSHISWQNATSPVPMEVYPSLAFDSVFENRGNRRNASILDRVSQQALTLAQQVSATDRHKLDEYLTSVREVETRIQKMNRAGPVGRTPSAAVAKMARPADGLPQDIREHMRLMCDLVALAFQSDKTRVATLLLCRDLSGLTYPFLDIRKAHHPASHDDRSDDYMRICRYYVEQLAYLGARLDAMKEGDGSVLDNTCLMFVSNMWSGSRHDASRLPVLLLGRLGGTLAAGRTLDYGQRADEDRKLCSLYLSLLARMNPTAAAPARFGDAAVPLADL